MHVLDIPPNFDKSISIYLLMTGENSTDYVKKDNICMPSVFNTPFRIPHTTELHCQKVKLNLGH